MKDFYYILGLEKSCTDQDIKTAFRRLSVKYHPDTNEGDRYFEPLLKSVSEAHQQLTTNRNDYNAKLEAFINSKQHSAQYHQTQRTAHQSPRQRAYEEMLKKEKEREEWIKNHPPPKPFSDPIFKKNKT